MNILILTPAYYPHIHPRAHRWTALAEHWAAQGHQVRVVCAHRRGFRVQDECNSVQVYRCGFESLQAILYYYRPGTQRRGRVGERPGKSGYIRAAAEWVYRHFWKKFYFPDDALFWIRPAERLSRRLMEETMPDVVITVSLPFSAHLVGLRLKRRCPALRWLVDIGDPYAIQTPSLVNRRLYGRLAARKEKEVLGAADQIVVTNTALREELLLHYRLSSPERIRVIPPLLWPLPETVPYRPIPGKIRMVYAGSLYPGLREPDDILHWLDALLKRKPDRQDGLELHWYGEVAPEYYRPLAYRPWVQLHGLCPREEVRRAMATADILVHIGNRSTFQLPSKAVDYLAAGRPVLHFQYVERDPFIDFWPSEKPLFVIQQGEPEVPMLELMVRFIENAAQVSLAGLPSVCLEDYLPERLGDLYLKE